MCLHLTGLWTFKNRLKAQTVECMRERKTSKFPVLDTNLYYFFILVGKIDFHHTPPL